jgi:hypothetical protein
MSPKVMLEPLVRPPSSSGQLPSRPASHSGLPIASAQPSSTTMTHQMQPPSSISVSSSSSSSRRTAPAGAVAAATRTSRKDHGPHMSFGVQSEYVIIVHYRTLYYFV